MSARVRRSISIGWLFALVGMCIVVPLLFDERAQLLDAEQRSDAALETGAPVDELASLLDLAPALGIEWIMTSTLEGIDAFPPDFTELISSDTEAQFHQWRTMARAQVDTAVHDLGDDAMAAELASIRDSLDADRLNIDAVEERYEALSNDVSVRVSEHLEDIESSASSIGGASGVLQATERVQLFATLQQTEATQAVLWARVAVPIFAPSTQNVRDLAHSLEQHAATVARLDAAVDGDDSLEWAWNQYQMHDAPTTLENRFDDGFQNGLEFGVEDTTGVFTVALPDETALGPLFATFLGEQADVVDLSIQRTALAATVGDQAIAGLQESIDDVVASTSTARRNAMFRVAAIAMGLIVVGLIVARLVARPLRRVADLASRLGDGQLNDGAGADHLPERGPTELRAAARAVNDSMDSLRLVEAQAVALADGDLSNPVLAQASTSQLSESIQSTVKRLAGTMNESLQFQRDLAHEASHDGLTGLANRTAVHASIEAALARSLRTGTSVALLFMDLDGFKAVNDTYGHRAGDDLLRSVGERLRESIRAGDTAGRLGGDEFVLLAEPVSGIDEAVELAERIHACLSLPVNADGVIVEPSVSIGVALAGGADLTADELLRDADLAVYRAKHRGRSRIEVCDDSLRDQQMERASVETGMRDGFEHGEFELYYQPVLSAVSGEVVSLEALIRWHRDGRLVPPNEFIPVAEKSSLIVELDEWVLSAAAAQLDRWASHPVMGQLPVSVNISSRHLNTGSFVNAVTERLAANCVAPDRLIVELTESAFLDDLAEATAQLDELRATGVKVALDDFGTGYMSLAVLRALPVDTLKVDCSFIARLDTAEDRALVELIIGSGHILGMDITAEGVETVEQADHLEALGADTVQGFYFSRPVAAAHIESFVSARAEVTVDPS